MKEHFAAQLRVHTNRHQGSSRRRCWATEKVRDTQFPPGEPFVVCPIYVDVSLRE